MKNRAPVGVYWLPRNYRPVATRMVLDEALTQLAVESPIRAELVKLRYFAGLTIPEAAATLGISVATAERYWAYARVRLYAALAEPTLGKEGSES